MFQVLFFFIISCKILCKNCFNLFSYNFTKIKIKSFECPKSIRIMKKIILGISDAWSMSRSSHRPSEPAYYIEDCRISSQTGGLCSVRADGRGLEALLASASIFSYQRSTLSVFMNFTLISMTLINFILKLDSNP